MHSLSPPYPPYSSFPPSPLPTLFFFPQYAENCNKPGPDQAMMHGYNNRFYTPNANASANCDCCGKIPLSQLRAGVEDNYTSSHIPTADVIVGWSKAKLGLA